MLLDSEYTDTIAHRMARFLRLRKGFIPITLIPSLCCGSGFQLKTGKKAVAFILYVNKKRVLLGIVALFISIVTKILSQEDYFETAV